jgi:hypothetical protein
VIDVLSISLQDEEDRHHEQRRTTSPTMNNDGQGINDGHDTTTITTVATSVVACLA